MNFKTTLLLLVILVVAATFAAVDHFRPVPAANGPSPSDSIPGAVAGRRLFDIAPSDVAAIRIEQADNSPIDLSRQDGHWRINEPVAAAADDVSVGTLAATLAGLQSTRQLDASAASGSTGLEPPQFQVQITTNSGKVLKLAIGEKTALEDGAYARLEGQSTIDIVAPGLWDNLNRKPDDWREHKMVQARPADVRQVALQHDGITVSLQKSDGQWHIVAPEKMPADQTLVNELLDTLCDLRAEDFVHVKPETARFDKPALTVWFSTAAPTTLPAATAPAGATLVFGRFQDISFKKLYLRRLDDPAVVTVLASTLEALKKSALDLRQREVLNIDPAQVSRLSLLTEKAATTSPTSRPAERREVVIQRHKEAPPAPLGPALPATAPATTMAATLPAVPPSPWEIVSDPKGFADSTRMDSLLGQLRPLKAVSFLSKWPVTQPSDAKVTYILKLTTEGPGGTPVTNYEIKIVDRGVSTPPVVETQGLMFEVDHTVLADLEADLTSKPTPEATPGATQEPPAFPPGQ